jgi:hypothetical protein
MQLIKKQVLDFKRFEFKYVLQTSLRKEVERELGFFVNFDPFVQQTPHHQYFVRSLYFDDRSHTAFYDKIDGLKTRSKFRIRTYTREADVAVPQFLEQKGRRNNQVFKSRVEIASTPAPMITTSTAPTIDSLSNHPSTSSLVQQFQHDRFRKEINPVALIDYVRRPYISKYDSEFRITFDEQLRATSTSELFPPQVLNSYPILLGYTVMEVKFARHIPAWFHRIIQAYELKRVSISKIVEGMKVLGLAIDL